MKDKRLKVIILVIVLIVIAIIIVGFCLKQNKYEVSFYSDGIAVLDTIQIKQNEKVTKPEDLKKDGYTFAG